jgi:hypothetical protein
MDRTPSWEANSYSASQDIHRLLRNPKVHYRVHKSPNLVPILSQPNQLHPIDPYLPKVQLNVIFPPTPKSFQWSLPFGPPNQHPENSSPLLTRAACPTHLILLDLINLTILDKEYRRRSSSLYNFLQDPSSSLLGPNIFLNTLFSETLSLCKGKGKVVPVL